VGGRVGARKSRCKKEDRLTLPLTTGTPDERQQPYVTHRATVRHVTYSYAASQPTYIPSLDVL